ncbi:MAG TPA: hypothetical protein VFQ61_18845 [Polyangiaceae bacterium]|nr:hypothetical protein [Polyangiaceae bacterium]
MRLRWAALVLLAFGCRAVAPAEAPQENPSPPSSAKPPGSTPKSAPIASTTSTAPAPERPPSYYGGMEPPRRTPAIAREEAHLEENYKEVPLFESLPPSISIDGIAAALPPDWHESREWLREWRPGDKPSELVRAAYLDSQEHYYLVWFHSNLNQLALVFDRRGRVTHRQAFSRARPTFRDVLALETRAERDRGATAHELVVFRITTMSLCCLPTDLEVYALGPMGKLRLILDIPKDHVDVGPGVRYAFLNHVDFVDQTAVVTQLEPESPLRWEFSYSPARGRFVPDAATVQSMKEERTRWQSH